MKNTLKLNNFTSPTTSSLHTSTEAVLHPSFITGFCDGEGSFGVYFAKKPDSVFG